MKNLTFKVQSLPAPYRSLPTQRAVKGTILPVLCLLPARLGWKHRWWIRLYDVLLVLSILKPGFVLDIKSR